MDDVENKLSHVFAGAFRHESMMPQARSDGESIRAAVWTPGPSRSSVEYSSSAMPDDLTNLKDDMTAFIEGHGMLRFHAYVGEEVPSVMWDSSDNPDSN